MNKNNNKTNITSSIFTKKISNLQSSRINLKLLLKWNTFPLHFDQPTNLKGAWHINPRVKQKIACARADRTKPWWSAIGLGNVVTQWKWYQRFTTMVHFETNKSNKWYQKWWFIRWYKVKHHLKHIRREFIVRKIGDGTRHLRDDSWCFWCFLRQQNYTWRCIRDFKWHIFMIYLIWMSFGSTDNSEGNCRVPETKETFFS